MPMPRQVSAQRVQEAAWTLDGTRIGWRSGNGGERAGRSRERRNGCGGLKQARGPRRYSRGLVAARYVTARGARPASDYSANLTRKVKVLDFIKVWWPCLLISRRR